jgi:hypothetical protein
MPARKAARLSRSIPSSGCGFCSPRRLVTISPSASIRILPDLAGGGLVDGPLSVLVPIDERVGIFLVAGREVAVAQVPPFPSREAATFAYRPPADAGHDPGLASKEGHGFSMD